MDINVYVRTAIEAYQQGLINLQELADELTKLAHIADLQREHNREFHRLRNDLNQWLLEKAERK